VPGGGGRAAIRAATDLQGRLAGEGSTSPTLPLGVGIGIDAGEAIPVEGGYRGAALNLAARLCSLAGPGEVLVSETVTGLARKIAGLQYTDRGAVQLKGFDSPVHVQEVRRSAGPVTEVDPAQRPVAQSDADLVPTQSLPIGGFLGTLPSGPFVGHDDDMAHVEVMLERVLEGTGQLLLLAGEPGAGKTRLAQEVTLRLRSRGFVIVAGRCYVGESATAYYPWFDALGAVYDALPPAERSEAARRWPELSLLLRDRMPQITIALEAADDQRVVRAVAAFVNAAAHRSPLAIMLDDLHWADAASLKLFAHLARSSHAERLLLLATYRDVEVGRHHPLEEMLHELSREGLAQRIQVRRLEETGTRALIGAIIGETDISDEFVRLIHMRTDGNPFFVEHVLHVLVERGDLFHHDGHWERRAVTDIQVPESVRAAIGQRLARLTEPTQEVLHGASVLGQTFHFDLLQEMTGKGEAEVEGALDEAGRVGLVREAGADRFSFDHALTQQALYEELTARRRRRYHLAAGEALEDLPPRRREERAGELAWHFLQGDDPERALHWSLAAAHAAESVYAHDDAADHYRSAVELAGDLHDGPSLASAVEGLCSALTLTGRYLDGLEVGERALELSRNLEDVEGELRASALIARIDSNLGETERGLARLDSLLQRIPPESHPTRGMALVYQSLVALYQNSGRFADKLPATERYAEIAHSLNDDALIADAGMRVGGALITVGRLEEGLAALEGTIPVARRLGATNTLALCYHNAADVYLWQGNFPRCREYREQDLVLSEGHGDPARIAFSHAWLGDIAFVQGDWESARRHVQRGMMGRDTLGSNNLTAYVVQMLGRLEAYAGDDTLAERPLEEAWQSSNHSNDAQLRSATAESRLVLLLVNRQVDGAEALLATMQQRRAGSDSARNFGERWFTFYPAWLACVRGDARSSAELAHATSAGWGAQHMPFAAPFQHAQLLGMALTVGGDWSGAATAFEEALARVRPVGYPVQEGWAYLEYARMLLLQGEHDAARAHAEAAEAILRPLGVGLLLPSLDAILAGVR
jgi:tetratricopeptide (TPR) repeat protein